MDFELSDDQVALQQAAADLLAARCTTGRVRQVADTGRHLDDDLWRAMAEQGWPAVELGQADGGLGLGLVEVAVLAEQLGRHLAPVPFLGTVLALGALSRAVAAGVVDADAPIGGVPLGTWIERLCAGDALGALCWPGRPNALAATTGADGWRLTGRADPVVYGPEADVIVAWTAPTEAAAGPRLFALGNTDPRPVAQPAMDRTRSLAWLELDGHPALALGDAAAAELLDRAVAALSAEMLGAASVVLEMTVQYAKDRVQFGRPIGSFQAVKHRCADMLVDVEGMRSAAYYAAWAVGAGDPDASAAASAAKVWCSDAARRVMGSGLQVHGGIGFTWEHDLHLYLKRSQLDQVSLGDAAYHRDRIAAILRPRAEAGRPVF